MKKSRFYFLKAILVFGFLITSTVQAQPPLAFKYQAVARDNLGAVIKNQYIGLKISIIQTSPLGSVLYSEVHNKKTNEFGLINIEVGRGTVVSGDISTIDWSADKHFLKVEMDPAGGTEFTEMGTSEFLSVPYALFAGKAGNESDSDSDPTNELQSLSLQDDTLFLSGDGFVILPPDQVEDGDSDPDNEIQELSYSDGTLYLSSGGAVMLPGKSLMEMSDLDTSGIKTGDLLRWSGSKWEPLTLSNLYSYYYADRDDDGYGDDYNRVYSPSAPGGFTETSGDCNDHNPDVHPGHTEDCDGIDNDCDGEIDEDCDTDDDGIVNYLDNCPEDANPGQEDNDEDGFGDVCDDDDDDDGHFDGEDNCPLHPNPDQLDTDDDGEGDVCDSDDDNDGHPDHADNCPLHPNPDQLDTDDDGEGDVCDSDDDNDGHPDHADNCPLHPNPDQLDTDFDGEGDVCDSDDDNDGHPDHADNCPLHPNPGQEDNDDDGEGDVCDEDDDNDGRFDHMDNCPLHHNPDQLDTDDDGEGDVCDSDDDNDGVQDHVDNCPLHPNPGQEDNDSDGEGDACDDDDDNDGDPDISDCYPYNPDIHHGATEICNGLDDNCVGGVDEGTLCPLTANVTATACAGINGCIITGCNTGFGDLDGIYENGCECVPDMHEPNDACASPTIFPLITPPFSGYYEGWISTLSDEDWWLLPVVDNGAFDVNIYFTNNPGNEFVFDVYYGDCANAEVTGVTSFHDPDTGGDDTKDIIIRIYRDPAATPTCNVYGINIDNAP